MIPQRKDAGAALLSILLIVATLSAAALIGTEAIARQTELHRLAARKATAVWSARSAEALALSSAVKLRDVSRLPADGSGEARQADLALPVDGGTVTLTLREMPACLNLNALGNPDPIAQQRSADGLRVLLEDIGVPATDALRAVAVLGDWIDADHVPRPYGAEDAAYQSLSNPLRPANQRLYSLDELAFLPEFTPDLRLAMKPFVCALPHDDPAPINMNALTPLSARVLRAAAAGTISETEARRIVELRPQAGWRDVQDFRETLSRRPQAEAALAGVPLTTQGEFFIGAGAVTLDTASWNFRFHMRAGNTGEPAIVWREFGGAG
ncbi:type II secretion system minor pseudopilin GspK [Hyphomonas sp.]|uniref:type II secretion system minor pseudopilin GspK n=1 Tax=Hyphomonas sp. TaxID=87 RepID=UPI00391B0921